MMRFFKTFAYQFQYVYGRALKETGLALDVYGSKLSNDIAWLEPLSRHRKIMPLYGQFMPVIFESTRIEDNSTIIGQVVLGDHVRVGYGCTLRADDIAIRVGHYTVIGDHTTIHCTRNRLPTHVLASVTIGQNVQIGDNCVITSAIIDDDVKVGSGSLVLDGSQLERGCVIAPDSVVPAGRLVPAHQLWAGNPIRFVKNLNEQEVKTLQ